MKLEKAAKNTEGDRYCAMPYHWQLEKYEDETDGLLYRIRAYNTFFRGMLVSIESTADCESISFHKQIESIHELQHAFRLCGVEKEIEL